MKWIKQPREARLASLAATDAAVAELLHANVELRRKVHEEQKARYAAQKALRDLQEAVHDLCTHYVPQDAEES